MYTKKTNKLGKEMYFQNGKLIAKRNIPDYEPIKNLDYELIEEMQPTFEKPIAEVESAPQENRSCIFCGQYGDYQKFVNLHYVRLCEDHYQQKTTGEIVQQIRESVASANGNQR